ncbi:hypothetical protein LOY97_004282 [Ophidiomyces ophidiicola]|nr:hypothetical protein LOZ49_005248 [Ophidiomyces ophidiicola]KAI2011220.1 hypothetical protein LOZ46_006157 [Ophidiomyces ophidiicola]KAI2130774.1 hypothetical protein LOZ29_005634 [Ophidiomyces ophidiicola]KAI2133416.1 hypothetical protein LOZ28_005443 [Ophidiomyces ophidiicola]KAI2211316.1 hypothetical protein LOZ15_005711 [Ophidiomyces ophidiicola]
MDTPSIESIENLCQDFDSVSELTSCYYCQLEEPVSYIAWMASSDVDQKFLGLYAERTSHDNPFLSAMLYKTLGLSVILSKKLLRARKLRRLDPTRENKSLHLYHHILWLSREGLIIVEQYILPMVADYITLKTLAYKLRASFYHIIVLFHNQPRVYQSGIHTFPPSSSHVDVTSHSQNSPIELDTSSNRDSIVPSPPPSIGGPVGGGSRVHLRPPGLGIDPETPKFAASFILPAIDYTPRASESFSYAAYLAEELLPGSHPIRLSVKLEYAAYLYDCVHDAAACRRVAKKAIADVYNAQEGMDDESFEDAAQLVGVLGKMVKRGAKAGSAAGSSAGVDKSWSEGSQTTPTRTGVSGENTPRTWHKRVPSTDGAVGSPGVHIPGDGTPI